MHKSRARWGLCDMGLMHEGFMCAGVQHCEFMHVYNRGLMQTLWLCIMRLMHGWLGSTRCACKSSGDSSPKDKRALQSCIGRVCTCFSYCCLHVFPRYLLSRYLLARYLGGITSLKTFGQRQVWCAEQCSDASIVLVAAILQGQGQMGVHASNRLCQSL